MTRTSPTLLLAAMALLPLAGCADRETTEPAGGPAALAAAVAEGQVSALTYNVHGVFGTVPGNIADLLDAYREIVGRNRRISPLLNNYDLAVAQENFVARLTLEFGFFRIRILLAGPYHALARDAQHPYRSGYANPLPPPVPPPVDLDVAFSDGLVRFSRLAFDSRDLLREGWAVCNGNDCFTNKGFSMARTELPATGAVVDVYNLHMNAGANEANLQARWDQARQLAEAIDRLSAGRAVIVAGDFNINPFADDPVQAGRDQEILDELLETTGLQDACTVLGCCEPTPGSPNSCDATQVDRFLFRSSDTNDGLQLILEPVFWNAKKEGSEFEGLSDHAAIETWFDWRLERRAIHVD